MNTSSMPPSSAVREGDSRPKLSSIAFLDFEAQTLFENVLKRDGEAIKNNVRRDLCDLMNVR